MHFTRRQLTLLLISLTLFYDEVAKTSSSGMKQELKELSRLIQDTYELMEE